MCLEDPKARIITKNWCFQRQPHKKTCANFEEYIGYKENKKETLKKKHANI